MNRPLFFSAFSWQLVRKCEFSSYANLRQAITFLALFFLFSCPSARADIILASDAGFVTEMGGSAKGDGTLVAAAKYNYSVGRELHYSDGALLSSLVAMDRKNYFVFDLSGVTGTITAAKFKVFTGETGYTSSDPSEMFELFETTDPGKALGIIDDLASSSSSADFDDASDPLVVAAKDLYGTLADGPILIGGYEVKPSDDDSTIEIDFTDPGLDYLNAFVGSKVVLGGILTTAPPPISPQLVFGGTGPDIPGGDSLTPVLEITSVPEPGGMVWCLGAVLWGGWIANRKTKNKKNKCAGHGQSADHSPSSLSR